MQMLNYLWHKWREKKEANSAFFYDFVVAQMLDEG
jgi:hypothetical protein